MTVVNTVARNNSLGYSIITEPTGIPYGNAVGKGTVLSNYRNLTVDNSTFIDNYAGESGSASFNNSDQKTTKLHYVEVQYQQQH